MEILDATARAAAAAQSDQTAQIADLAALWAGDVVLRYYTSGGTLLRTVTHAAWVQSTDTGRRQMTPGAIAAESRFSTGTAAYCIAAVPAGADILRCDVSLGAAVTDPGGRVNLGSGSGAAGLVVQADAGLPLSARTDGGDQRITLWGQSNALGVAAITEISATPLSGDAGLATLAGSSFSRAYIWTGAAYEQLLIGTNNGGYTTSLFGAEFGLAVRWMRETASGILFIDKAGIDGAVITQFLSGESWFIVRDAQRDTANTWLSSNGHGSTTDAGFVWVQGESDIASSEAAYRSSLNQLISDRIAAGLQTSGELRIMAQVNSGNTNYGAGVAAAKVAYVADNATGRIITYTNNLNGDNLHLNGKGQLQLGYDAYSALFNAPTVSAP